MVFFSIFSMLDYGSSFVHPMVGRSGKEQEWEETVTVKLAAIARTEASLQQIQKTPCIEL